MKMHRSPFAANTQGDLIIARRNPRALWLSDYEDRIIYDGRKQGAAKYAGLMSVLKPLLPNDKVEDLAAARTAHATENVAIAV